MLGLGQCGCSSPDVAWPPSAAKNHAPHRYRSWRTSGSIFSSAKLSAANSNGNPFAVRVTPPSRSSEHGDGSSQSILAPSRLAAAAAAGGTAGSESKSKLILRPSALASSSAASKSPTATAVPSGILRPATLINPFAKSTDNEDDAEAEGTGNGQEQAGSQTKENESPQPVSTPSTGISTFLAPSRLAVPSSGSTSGSTSMSDSTAPAAASEDGHDSGTSSSSSASFPSLFSSTASRQESTFSLGFSAPASTGFVFGQNLHERVANHDGTASGGESASSTTTTLSSGNLFSIPEKSETESGPTSNGAKSLTESARELEAKASKRKYDEVTVVTGEEDEQNALQMNAKLCIFDKAQGWIERGRGTLRLNDKHGENQTLQSRIVMRTQGSLRVILNTKVWSEMTIDKASTKSIRMTAMDGDQIRVFLITSSPKDTDTLFNAVEWRLATLRSQLARTATTAKAPASEEECEELKKRKVE